MQALDREDPCTQSWALLELCATPLAIIDAGLLMQAVNPALCEWLAAGVRNWRGEAIGVLDAKPPLLSQAAQLAFAQNRRLRVREARLRTALGDRGADVALTPIDADRLLLELHPLPGEPLASRLSESLRGFAHEVKGPLAGVRGAAQLLQRRVDSAELAELAGLIIGEADRLAALSDRLLQTGVKPRLARVNIHEILERVAALLAAESDGPSIRRDYDPSLPSVSADADRLQQALLNLARNAIEAGAHALTLRTRAEHAARVGDQAARLLVRVDMADDGRGVAAEVADTLFEPMVSSRANGSGLGLAIAREIAREHGGELGYVSRPGATVFSLLLPVSE